jgi:hypothetical protein
MVRGTPIAFALMLAALASCGYPPRYCALATGRPQTRLCGPCNQGSFDDCRFADNRIQCWGTNAGPKCRGLCTYPWHFACDGKCHFTPFRRNCYDAGADGC